MKNEFIFDFKCAWCTNSLFDPNQNTYRHTSFLSKGWLNWTKFKINSKSTSHLRFWIIAPGSDLISIWFWQSEIRRKERRKFRSNESFIVYIKEFLSLFKFYTNFHFKTVKNYLFSHPEMLVWHDFHLNLP